MTTDALLEIDGLTVRYAGRREPALRGISLSVRAGETVSVAGRTGAGKSTLTLAAAGFIPRVVRARLEGIAVAAGTLVDRASPAELAGRVGIVFSTPANQLSASKLTVREELAFGLENLGVARAEMDDRIDSILARLGIEHLAERDPFALSGGEQQRVAIASIVAMGTSLLVLDEPTAQLDPAGTSGVATLLRELAADGTGVLCAEHAPTVLGASDRCLLLDAGDPICLDLPGVALGPGVMEARGLRSPTVVRLAQRAGVPPERAFDENAIVDAFEAQLADVQAGARAGARAGAGTTADMDGGWLAPPSPSTTGLEAFELAALRGRETERVAIRGLVHAYPGGVVALRGVDLDIAPGESVAIVGQNGSGKTTLAKHLNGLLRPDEGRIVIGERDIRAEPVSEVARTVGFVFQNPDDQLFNRSVEREVEFGPRNLSLDGSMTRALVDRALELTGLAQVRTVNPFDLGLSLRKLVALASILAMEPSVLVLDEPTTGQDGPGIERIGAIVDIHRAAGRTVVAITHDMDFAARHFGRIVVMRDGRVIADGEPGRVFAPENHELLGTTGIHPPAPARIGARLGLGATPTEAALVAALAARAIS